MHYLGYDLILHLTDCLNILSGELSCAIFEKLEMWLTLIVGGIALLISFSTKWIRLLNEIDKGLGLYKFFEEPPIFLDILDVFSKVEYFIGTISTRKLFLWAITILRGCSLFIIEIFKGVDQEDKEIEKLLFDFECESFPKNIRFLPGNLKTLEICGLRELPFELLNQQLGIWLRQIWEVRVRTLWWGLTSDIDSLGIKIKGKCLITNGTRFWWPSGLAYLPPERAGNTNNERERRL